MTEEKRLPEELERVLFCNEERHGDKVDKQNGVDDYLFNLDRIEMRDIVFVQGNCGNGVYGRENHKPCTFFFDAVIYEEDDECGDDYSHAKDLICADGVSEDHVDDEKERDSQDTQKSIRTSVRARHREYGHMRLRYLKNRAYSQCGERSKRKIKLSLMNADARRKMVLHKSIRNPNV